MTSRSGKGKARGIAAGARERTHSLESIFFVACEEMSAPGHDAESHVRTMSHYAVETMRELMGRKLTGELCSAVSRAVLLHDFGKLFISERILRKRAPLTKQEREKIRSHPEMAHLVFKRTPLEMEAKAGILYHHERFDGTGYPKQLKGESIPLVARVVAVVDAYEAMTHDRPYKRAMSRKQAIEELRRSAGLPFAAELTEKKRGELQFDPRVVEAFLKVHRRRHPELYKE